MVSLIFLVLCTVPLALANPVSSQVRVQNYSATEDNIKIYFHSRNTDENGTKVDLENINTISATDFSTSKDTVFIIHGWRSDHISPVNKDIKEAYLSAVDVNLFVVDWSSIAHLGYIFAQSNVVPVGQVVGKLINDLVRSGGLQLNKTAFVGHSLGAHIAGIAGAAVGGATDHIVGLDPAGPLFNVEDKSNRLDTSDSKFVHVIHTNANLLGFASALGHADYWPNGGHIQSGCELDLAGSCSHDRAYLYYAESVKNGNFIARRCESYTEYEDGNCGNGAKSDMGGVYVDKSASGSYYLDTNSQPPYARSESKKR